MCNTHLVPWYVKVQYFQHRPIVVTIYEFPHTWWSNHSPEVLSNTQTFQDTKNAILIYFVYHLDTGHSAASGFRIVTAGTVVSPGVSKHSHIQIILLQHGCKHIWMFRFQFSQLLVITRYCFRLIFFPLNQHPLNRVQLFLGFQPGRLHELRHFVIYILSFDHVIEVYSARRTQVLQLRVMNVMNVAQDHVLDELTETANRMLLFDVVIARHQTLQRVTYDNQLTEFPPVGQKPFPGHLLYNREEGSVLAAFRKKISAVSICKGSKISEFIRCIQCLKEKICEYRPGLVHLAEEDAFLSVVDDAKILAFPTTSVFIRSSGIQVLTRRLNHRTPLFKRAYWACLI